MKIRLKIQNGDTTTEFEIASLTYLHNKARFIAIANKALFDKNHNVLLDKEVDYSGQGITIELAILDLCRSYEREHNSG